MSTQATAPAPSLQPQPDYSKTRFQFLEEPKCPGIFRRVLRKHQRLLAFIGAVIVFGTFIVNEGVRETVKGRIDSIKQLQGLLQSTVLMIAPKKEDIDYWSSIDGMWNKVERASMMHKKLQLTDGERSDISFFASSRLQDRVDSLNTELEIDKKLLGQFDLKSLDQGDTPLTFVDTKQIKKRLEP